ncbi:MAG: ribbon-helix-helix protein, CopG family [Sedimenticola sp.]
MGTKKAPAKAQRKLLYELLIKKGYQTVDAKRVCYQGSAESFWSLWSEHVKKKVERSAPNPPAQVKKATIRKDPPQPAKPKTTPVRKKVAQPGAAPKVTYSFKIDQPMLSQLEAVAADEERSVGAVIRLALKQYLARSGS